MQKRGEARKEARVAARHSEQAIYVAWVLWVIGVSEAGIAGVLGKRRKQIAGIVNRSDYANRSAMSIAERQAALGELLKVRFGDDGKAIDGGMLDRVPMKVMELRGRQHKRSRS